jgi:hypothetical protein
MARVKPCEPFSTSAAYDPVYTSEKPQASPWDSVVVGLRSEKKGLCNAEE